MTKIFQTKKYIGGDEVTNPFLPCVCEYTCGGCPLHPNTISSSC